MIGIGLISMNEKVMNTMVLRMLDHILQYGNIYCKRAIPLTLAILPLSTPDLSIMDILSKLTHDQDYIVSQNAIIALGLIGAGTNHARIAEILRNLAIYFGKEPNHLFLVRIAQGILHLGKGLLTISPYQQDSLLLSHTSLCGILTIIHSMINVESTILDDKHYLLYSLTTAISTRMLMTIDVDTNEAINIEVRVGQKGYSNCSW